MGKLGCDLIIGGRLEEPLSRVDSIAVLQLNVWNPLSLNRRGYKNW